MTSTEKQRAKRILIVDDDLEIQHLLAAVLRRRAFDVVFARDGDEARRAVKAFDPDLILLDLMMPRVDGFQFLSTLKDDPERRQVPIVVLSAHLQADPERVLALGATTLLPKPFDIDQLTDLIQCLL